MREALFLLITVPLAFAIGLVLWESFWGGVGYTVFFIAIFWISWFLGRRRR